MATFSNYATLSYIGGTVVSNTVTGELQEAVSAAKTAVSGTYTAGGDVTYVLSILNSGMVDASGLTVTDDLGGYTFGDSTVYPLAYVPDSIRYYINGTLQPAPTVTGGPPLTIQGIDIPAGGNVILVYEAEVTAYAPPGADGEIANTAVITGGWLSGPITATETISSENGSKLSIRKDLSPLSVAENGEITYTFTIENTGNAAADASDSIVLTDTFDPVLNPISVTYNKAVWTEGVNYTYSPTTGLLTSTAGQITVPAASANQLLDGSWEIIPGTTTIVVTGTV